MSTFKNKNSFIYIFSNQCGDGDNNSTIHVCAMIRLFKARLALVNSIGFIKS